MVAVIARAIARVSTSDELETLKLLTMFGLLGLLLCMVAARFDLDTRWAFF